MHFRAIDRTSKYYEKGHTFYELITIQSTIA
jgi:hypothetical protein